MELTNTLLLQHYSTWLHQVYSERSAKAYYRDVERLEESLACPLATVETNTLNQFLEDLKKKQKPSGECLFKPSSIRRCYTAMKGFFEFLKEHGYRVDNPMEGISSPQHTRASETIECLSEEEVQGLIRAADELNKDTFVRLRDILMIQLSVETGIRMGELLALTTSQVNLEQGILTIVGREGLVRQVPMSEALITCFNDYFYYRQAIPTQKVTRYLVFTTTRGGKYTTQLCHAALVRYGQTIGLTTVSQSILRHTCAYRLIQEGRTIHEMATYLGHVRDYTIKENYGKWMISTDSLPS